MTGLFNKTKNRMTGRLTILRSDNYIIFFCKISLDDLIEYLKKL